MAAITASELQSLIGVNLADNDTKAITPELLREVFAKVVESLVNKVDGGTVNAAVVYGDDVPVTLGKQLATKDYVDANAGGTGSYNELNWRSASVTLGSSPASYSVNFGAEIYLMESSAGHATVINFNSILNAGQGKSVTIVLDSKHLGDSLNVTLGSGITIYPSGGPFVAGVINIITITSLVSAYRVTIDPQV